MNSQHAMIEAKVHSILFDAGYRLTALRSGEYMVSEIVQVFMGRCTGGASRYKSLVDVVDHFKQVLRTGPIMDLYN